MTTPPSSTAPRLAPTPLPPPSPRANRSPRRLLVPAVIVAALALLVWGMMAWSHARGTESTDDAQLEGNIVPVLARVGGYVQSVEVADNQSVNAGQVLVTIDDRELQTRLARAEADLAAARASAGTNGQEAAQLRGAKQDVVRLRAEASRADADLARYRSLEKSGMVSRQQLEQAETAAEAARAQLAGAHDAVTGAAAESRGADSRVASAAAARDEAALQASFTRIAAPGRGVVSKKSVEVGQLVQPGQPLMALVPLQDVWVVANLKETQLAKVRPGAPVDIRVDAYGGREFRGHVESLSPATGSKFSLLPADNATGNFVKVVQRVPVKIAIDGPRDAATPLRPGMSAHVTIRTGA